MSRLKSKTTPGDTLRTRPYSYRRLGSKRGISMVMADDENSGFVGNAAEQKVIKGTAASVLRQIAVSGSSAPSAFSKITNARRMQRFRPRVLPLKVEVRTRDDARLTAVYWCSGPNTFALIASTRRCRASAAPWRPCASRLLASMSAVGQNRPVAVEIKGLKTTTFWNRK
jgi:hypothetical protein